MPHAEGPTRGAHAMTVQECRDILGPSVADKSDDQIAKMLDDLECLAATMYDDLMNRARIDIEDVRWTAYAVQNPEDAC